MKTMNNEKSIIKKERLAKILRTRLELQFL